MLRKAVLALYLIVLLATPLFSQENLLQTDSPNITRVEIVSVGPEEATISWINSDASCNILAYGTTQALDQKVVLGTSTCQCFCLKGLKPDKKYFYRIKNNRQESSSIRSFQTLSLPPGKYLFSFAVMTDLHYSSRGQGISGKGELFGKIDQIIDNAVAQINEHQVDFTMVKGDIAHRGTRFELDAVSTRLNRLNGNVFVVVGNHEMVDLRWKVNFREIFGQANSYYSFSHKSWHFIVLNSAQFASSEGFLSPTQLAWLDQDLNTHKQEKTMIFLHHMVDEPAGINELAASFGSEAGYTGKTRFIKNIDEFKTVLEKHPQVVSVNSGHAHINLVTKNKGITYVTTAALIHYPVTYNICHVYENGYVQLAYKVHQNLKEAEESRSIMVNTVNQRFSGGGKIGAGIVFGNLSDRSFVVDLTKTEQDEGTEGTEGPENLESEVLRRLLGD